MRLLIFLLLGYIVFQYLRNRSTKELPADKGPSAEETHKDPVCGVYVAHDDAVVGTLEGEKIYFCSMACLEKFREQLNEKK
ncbi:MAG TPA: transcriptional regulator [Geobacteraceae bacterium]